MEGANGYIDMLREKIKVGDRIISLREDLQGGIVTGLYPHIFTVKTPKGYTEAIAYRECQDFVCNRSFCSWC